jgi:hypothetical protein
VRFSTGPSQPAVPSTHEAPVAEQGLEIAPLEPETTASTAERADAPAEKPPEFPTPSPVEAATSAQDDATTAISTSGQTEEGAAEVYAEPPVEAPLEPLPQVREALLEEKRVEPPVGDSPEHDTVAEIHAAGPVEAPVEVPAGPTPSPAAHGQTVPAPAIDWDLLYLIVRKVVLKMSPPAISREDAEELARRLADETAFELSAELPSPRH